MRDKNALEIWLGACNPSGIALAIVEACKEARYEYNTIREKKSLSKF